MFGIVAAVPDHALRDDCKHFITDEISCASVQMFRLFQLARLLAKIRSRRILVHEVLFAEDNISFHATKRAFNH